MTTERVREERLALIAQGIVDRLDAGASGAPDLDRDIAGAITELLSLRSRSGGMKVKGLEWVGDEAVTPFGKYRVVRTDDGFALTFEYEELAHIGFNAVRPFESARDEAARRAQPDYERRILSALEPAEPGEGEVVAWPPIVELGRVLGFFSSVIKSGEPWTETCQQEYEKANTALQALYASPLPEQRVTDEKTIRPEIKSETEILKRLAEGDEIAFSQDGDDAFFTKGDRAFVGRVILSMRSKGYLKRIVADEENYRGMSERDVISDAGRAALTAALTKGGQ